MISLFLEIMKNSLYIAAIVAGFSACTGIYLNYNQLFVYPELRAHVAQGLKDPESASFRGERVTPAGWLCGEVNAKNSYGAYTGFKRFMSVSASQAYVDGLGYVGAGDKTTSEVISDLNVRNEVLSNVLQVAKDSGGTRPTQDEIDRLTESAIFDRRWTEVCADAGGG